jgi:histone H3/H4
VDRSFWKHCSTCKKEIPFRGRYHACNVSTCNRGHTALAFCSVECWDSHVPLLRHRDAWSLEKTAPSKRSGCATRTRSSRRRASRARGPRLPCAVWRRAARLGRGAARRWWLLLKLKAYVRARSGMNTSDAAIDVLSDKLRELCDRAVEKAVQAGRKTLLDRDF